MTSNTTTPAPRGSATRRPRSLQVTRVSLALLFPAQLRCTRGLTRRNNCIKASTAALLRAATAKRPLVPQCFQLLTLPAACASGPPARRTLATSSSGGIPGSNPRPHSTALDADPAGGSGYAVLAAAHAALAATALVAPAAVANVFFPGAALPQGMQTQVRDDDYAKNI